MPVEIDLLAVARGAVTAPAGCGKTHLIADALSRHTGAKPILVLTHTNAGVAALRTKLDRAAVPSRSYRLTTIDGWAIRLVSTFPARSGLNPLILQLRNRANDYPAIRDAALRLLGGGHVDDVLSANYDRLIVDEYQDCSVQQHEIVVFASRVLRTVVLGDPVQAIFGFNGNPLADWEAQVCMRFPVVGQLQIPQRWVNAGEEAFGRWLLQMREHLRGGGPLNLGDVPPNVTWMRLAGNNGDHPIRLTAGRTPVRENEKVLILADTRPNVQREFARQIPGAITVENVDLTDLVEFGDQFNLQSPAAFRCLVELAGKVMIGVGVPDMLSRVDSLRNGRARREATDAESAAISFVDHSSYRGASALLEAISRQAGVRSHRPAILRGAYNLLKICSGSSNISPAEAVTIVREQSRLIGRPLAKRTVGSTLLLKGLEADVSVILSPELMDHRNLYVAMTRGSKRLIICSREQIIRPR